jgi:ATP-dependent DNA helicase RecG
VRVECQRLTVDGKELLIVQVPNHPEAVMVDGNGFPYRVGDQVVREPQEVINDRKQAYRRVGYEQRIRPEATLEDLDLELARRFLGSGAWADRPIADALNLYGLAAPSAQGMRITNAALLLFGKPPAVRWHPRAGIRFFRVDGTERRHGADRNVEQLPRLDPPLAAMIPESYRLAQTCIRKSEKLYNLFFREMPEYPTFAWQEALINAAAHRDYNDQGRETEVWFFDDRMEVWSPGDLVPPVTLEKLQHHERVHASRNPLLVRVLADVALMREEGEGLARMYAEMDQSALKPPELHADAATFRVALFNEPTYAGPSAEWKGMLEGVDLKPTQKRVLMAHPAGFSNEEYRDLAGVDRDTAYKDIQELIAAGIVQASGLSGRGARYRLTRDWQDTLTWLESRLPKLRAFFAAHATLANRDYRELFGVERYGAVREIGRLVELGFLARGVGVGRAAGYTPTKSLMQA